MLKGSILADTNSPDRVADGDIPRARALAFVALLLGGAALGLSPIFVRLADVGPTASAFWRLALAVPVLWLWVVMHPRRQAMLRPSLLSAALLAGVFFAADLGVWHWSITYTTVANSTLLANFAPIFVTLGGWLLFRAGVSGTFVIAMITALAGTTFLVGPSFALGGRHVTGDALGLLTAVFYAAYMLSIKHARATVSTALLMALSTTVSVVLLLPVAVLSPQPMFPSGLHGWSILFGLALISQVLGQSLIAYAFAHLSAALSSVTVLIQPIVATILAWALFSESLSPAQLLGGVLVLVGIFVARRTG
jgi:drug/metabolite transporter (DMT)-like permease